MVGGLRRGREKSERGAGVGRRNWGWFHWTHRKRDLAQGEDGGEGPAWAEWARRWWLDGLYWV